MRPSDSCEGVLGAKAVFAEFMGALAASPCLLFVAQRTVRGSEANQTGNEDGVTGTKEPLLQLQCALECSCSLVMHATMTLDATNALKQRWDERMFGSLRLLKLKRTLSCS